MRQLRQRMAMVAHSPAPVLLVGETGVGKERVAAGLRAQRLIDEGQGKPRPQPWVALNCAGLTPALAASELFGHVRGAFTGAHTSHVGAFAAADGGTLFLDEVGELPGCVQPQLLRALELGEIRALGAVQPRQVQVQLVAATHRNLTAEIAAGRFRSDLYHRLGVLVLHVPPLRHRPEDLPQLVAELCLQLGHPQMQLTPAAWAKLYAYGWPGNVRELRNVLHRAWVFGNRPVVDVEALEFAPTAELAGGVQSLSTATQTYAGDPTVAVRRHGSLQAAAAALGCSRSTLYRRLRRARTEASV
jgi:DNA-binding NtrC family response regulator